MKKVLSFALSMVLLFGSSLLALPAAAAIQTEKSLQAIPSTVSGAYIVMDAKTGQILIEKNMDQQEYPASITKILTAAMALEVGDPSDLYTITQEDVFSYKFPGTTYVALTHDEVVPVEALLYGTLMASANDAANCLGSYAASKAGVSETDENGTQSYVKGFVTMMNNKLKEIGATNTNFTNAHGLHDQNHYTTARDMALITKYALEVEGFRDYFGAIEYTMAPTNMQPEQRKWGTQAGIFTPSNKYYFEGATGAKLGFTDEAGHTMVSVAERNGREFICVVLACPQGEWTDHKDSINLLNYCFDNFEKITFTADELKQKSVPIYKDGEISEKAKVTAKEDYSLELHRLLKKEDIKIVSNAPGRFQSGDRMSVSLHFSLNKAAEKKVANYMYTNLGTLPLTVTEAPLVEETKKTGFDFSGIWEAVKKCFKIVLWIFLALVVLIIILRIYNTRRYRKLAAKRKAAKRRRQTPTRRP